MPWNGNAPDKTFARSDGTRNGTQVWQQAEADGVDIVSNDHDTHDQDLAAGINAAVLRDGGNTALADLPMGNYRHTGVGDAARLNQYQTLSQALANGGLYVPSANVGGTGNAITLTTTYNVATLAAGHKFAFVVAANNTDAAAVVIDGIASVAITRQEDGSDLEPGDLYEGAIAVIQHDGTNFQLLNRHMVDGGGGGDTQTGAEIVSAINAELGSDNWQESAVAPTLPVEFADVDARITVIGQTNEYAGGGCGEYTVRVTADGRIVVCGDTGGLGLDAAGDNYGGFELEWDRLNNGTITAVYCGSDYLLVQTNQTVGNLWSVGINTTYGVLGHGNTTSLKTLTRIAYFQTTNPVKISKVWTEAGTAIAADRFWFAIDTTGNLYSCGSGTNYTQGGNSTSNVTTPRPVTQSDGTTQLTGIVEVSCCSVHAPVFARTSAGTLWRWGAGTSGAAGQGAATDLTWPAILGGGTPTDGITKAVVTGTNISATRAAGAIVEDGVLKVAGDRNNGIGDGTTSGTPVTAFTTVAGSLASRTTTDVAIGGGEFPIIGAIDSYGDLWLAGFGTENIYGAGAATAANNTFTRPTFPSRAVSTVTITNASPAVVTWSGHRHVDGDRVHFSTSGALPSGLTENSTYYVINADVDAGTFQVSASVGGVAVNTSTSGSGTQTGRVNVSKVRIGGFNAASTVYAEANGVVYAIGEDTYYQTAQNVAASTKATRTWQRMQGQLFANSEWYVTGPRAAIGTHMLCSNGHSRYVGYNAQGQGGVQPSNLHAVVTLQAMQSAGPRLLKPPTLVGAYSAGTEYSYNDEVTQQGGSWRYIYATATTGNAPPTLPTTSTTYWRLAAAPGDDGISMEWVDGGWQSGDPYERQQALKHNGSSYACIVDHTAGSTSEPGVGVSWATYWELVAEKGDTGATGAAGATGLAGTTGATGAAAPAFIDYSLDPSSTADSDPGSGKLRPNNATAASVTTFFFDDLDRLGVDQTAELATWDDSTSTGSKGKLYIIDLTTPASRWTYDVTAYTSETGYKKITVTHRAGTAAWPTGNVGLLFVPRGDKGSDGAGTGDLVAANNLSDVASAATAFANIKQAASETATGVVELATTAETVTGSDTSRAVTPAGVAAAIAALVDSSPAALNTLDELAAALGDDPNFATTVATSIGEKAAKSANLSDLASAATAFGNIKQAASETATGVVEMATTAEVVTGSDTSRAVTPAGVKAALDKQSEVIVIPVSDEATAITTGTAKVTFRMPFAMTLTAVRGSLTEASSSGTPTIDINEAGSTILSTKLTIDASEKTSTTAATAVVISDTGLADDAEITIDIDTAGTGAKGLKVSLIGYRT